MWVKLTEIIKSIQDKKRNLSNMGGTIKQYIPTDWTIVSHYASVCVPWVPPFSGCSLTSLQSSRLGTAEIMKKSNVWAAAWIKMDKILCSSRLRSIKQKAGLMLSRALGDSRTRRPFCPLFLRVRGLPGGSAGKESTCNAGDLGSIPGLGRSPGEAKGYPPQYSGLENSMDCIVHGVAKSRTWLSDFHFTSYRQNQASMTFPQFQTAEQFLIKVGTATRLPGD